MNLCQTLFYEVPVKRLLRMMSASCQLVVSRVADIGRTGHWEEVAEDCGAATFLRRQQLGSVHRRFRAPT
jgi:hypothetical protein